MIHRSLNDIIKRAEAELRINPSITVYTFENGVEQRRPANPWAKFNAAMRETTVSFERLRNAFTSIGDAFRHITMPEFNAWADDEQQRRKWNDDKDT